MQLARSSLGAAHAQLSIDDVRAVFDTLELKLEAQDDDIGVIDFENVRGREFGGGIILNSQYAKTHGVMFGPGVTVHACASQFRTTSEVGATNAVRLDDRPCIYPKAASGEHVGFFQVGRAGAEMSLSFPEPVQALALKINPTGGGDNEEFIATVRGYRDAKSEKPDFQSSMRFTWNQSAISWPHIAAIETKGAQLERVTVSLRRASGDGQSVRFLFDDLALVAAPEEIESPLADAIAQREPRGRGIEPEIVRSPELDDANGGLRVFNPPTEVRLPIDWDAVATVVDRQAELGMRAAPVNGADQAALDRATLPVVLPAAADAPIDLAVQASGDSYSAVFELGGHQYEIYGTRLFTVVGDGDTAGAGVLRMNDMEYGRAATFSIFGGASYRVIRYCDTGSAAGDAACEANTGIAERIAELMVALGDAAEGRP